MPVSPAQPLRQLIQRYVSGEVPVAQFRDQFVDLTDSMSYSDGDAADDLAGEVELAYAEFTNGDIDDVALRARLNDAIHLSVR